MELPEEIPVFELFTFLADDGELINEGIRFRNLPANYVAWFLIPLGTLAFAWFFYRRESRAPQGLRIGLTLTRALAIFFVFLLIFEPFRQFRRVEEIRSLVTVVIDGSASMERRDPYAHDEDRADAVREGAGLDAGRELKDFSRSDLVKLSLEESKLIDKIREKHETKLVLFSSGSPRPISDLDELSTDGPLTATGNALAQVVSDPEIQAKPSTSVVLISDGRSNTGMNPVDVARNAGENDRIPVHTVGVGDPDALRDIELRFIRADEVALRGDIVKMALVVRNRGFPDGYLRISVSDAERRSWAPVKRERLKAGEADQVFEIELRADRVGEHVLEVTVLGPTGEENVANNKKKHRLTVKDEALKVLYVDTLPRWEYRKLKDFLVRGGESFRAHCLLLSAEPNFIQEYTRGIPGFVPIREFPTEFEALDEYDVLIFGDVNPQELVPTFSKRDKVLKNIQRFVDGGGGLVVVAGEGWTPQAYVDTPLEELLPVDISNGSDVGPMGNFIDEWKPKLTAVGRNHPIMQLESDAALNVETWEQRDRGLMELRWFYPVRKAMPGAQVLAVHPDQRNQFGNYPLWVAGTYGDGPVLFAATDESWRWYHQVGPYYFNRFWGGVTRHLARAHLYRGSKRYKLLSDASRYQQGETVYLTAFVKDTNFDEGQAPTQRVMLVEPGSRGRMIEFEKRSDGEYTHAFRPTKNGSYEAWIVGDEGVAGKRYAPIDFEVEFIDPERQNPAINEDELRAIADESGGAYFRLEESLGLLERLRADTTRRSKADPEPLKNRLWLPAVLLALLSVEWILRKRFRMA